MEGKEELRFKVNLSEEGASRLAHRLTLCLKHYTPDFVHGDDTLVKYVIVLLGNGRSKEEVKKDLDVFLADNTHSFVTWLWDHLASHLDQYVQPPKPKSDLAELSAETDSQKLLSDSEKGILNTSRNRHNRDWKGLMSDETHLPLSTSVTNDTQKEENVHIQVVPTRPSASPTYPVNRKISRADGLPGSKPDEQNGIGNVFNTLVKQLSNPVEFELPDWFNKWQPAPYTFIKRNIYLTKKSKKRHEDDGIFCSCSQSPESNAVCGRDCHCAMLLSGCSSGCRCGSACVNKPFQHRPVKKMKLVQTEKCGSGIVADEDIKQGEFVIEYVGEVIDDKECEERLWKMKHRGETNFYLCEVNRDMVIDASYKGNKSRYINHCCCPNTEMQKWSIDGETRIGIFATRDIIKGEHLTYDYQFVQFGADQDCHCGAVSCRRKLGVKPNKTSSDAALKLVARQVYQNGGLRAGMTNNSKRNSNNCIGEVVMILRPVNKRFFGIIKRFDNISKKHLIMFEDGAAEFIDMSKEVWEVCNLLL